MVTRARKCLKQVCFCHFSMCQVQDCTSNTGWASAGRWEWDDPEQEAASLHHNHTSILNALNIQPLNTATEYGHWLKWHLIVTAAQRMSFHTRNPFCPCQKLTSGSVTVSEALREVWKGLAGSSGSVLSCWGQLHQDKAAQGGWSEPHKWSCWKLWCSHVSAQTLHSHRILVCSYTTITLALNGDVFTSYSLKFCWEQPFPSSAFRSFG